MPNVARISAKINTMQNINILLFVRSLSSVLHWQEAHLRLSLAAVFVTCFFVQLSDPVSCCGTQGNCSCFGRCPSIMTVSSCSVLFCSLAFLGPRVGHTMDVLCPFISILCHSDWLFHRESCPRLDVVYPGRACSSSPACTWHCSLHYFFLQAIPLFSHGVTIVC